MTGIDPGWELAGESVAHGWMPVPAVSSEADAAAWAAAQTTVLREAWGAEWQPLYDTVVPAMLGAALAHRRADDVFVFQVWPTQAPVCIFVHASAGSLPADAALPGPGEGILYEAEGLGAGVCVPIVEDVDGRQVTGAEFIFIGGGQGVSVYVEPTVPDLLAILMPSIHGFVQSLTLTDRDGERFRAAPPALIETAPDAAWVDAPTG